MAEEVATEGTAEGQGNAFKEKTRRITEHHWVEVAILVLVLFDVIFVSIEAGIDHEIFCINGKVVPRPSSMPAEEHHGLEHHESYLSMASTLHSHGMRLRNSRSSLGGFALAAAMVGHEGDENILACDTKHGHHAEHIMHTCHFWSIVILVIFTVELIIKGLVVPGYYKNPFHKLDCFVVIVSLIIDAIVLPYVEHQAREHATAEEIDKEKDTMLMVVALLVFSRFWRLVRIIHGLYEQYEAIAETAKEEGKKMEEGENELLRQALVDVGLNPDQEIERRQ